MKSVLVIGLGLIGGSIGLSLRAMGVHVLGADLPDALKAREGLGVTDELIDVMDEQSLKAALSLADLTVIATPVAAIAKLLPFCVEHAPVVTDCGSTKRFLLEAAQKLPHSERFVPGHPMAGLPGGGAGEARADLFAGRPWLVCAEGASEEALNQVSTFIQCLKAREFRIPAVEHDRAVALTSHLPQLLGSLLKVMVHEHRATPAAGPSYERMTLAAGGADAIWRDIFATNADLVAGSIRELIQRLEPLADELERAATQGGASQSLERVLALLEQARTAPG